MQVLRLLTPHRPLLGGVDLDGAHAVATGPGRAAFVVGAVRAWQWRAPELTVGIRLIAYGGSVMTASTLVAVMPGERAQRVGTVKGDAGGGGGEWQRYRHSWTKTSSTSVRACANRESTCLTIGDARWCTTSRGAPRSPEQGRKGSDSSVVQRVPSQPRPQGRCFSGTGHGTHGGCHYPVRACRTQGIGQLSPRDASW